MNDLPPLKDSTVNVRVPGALKARAAEIDRLYGVPEATLIRDSLEAILDYIEREGGYKRPVRMVRGEFLQAVAEPPAHYGKKDDTSTILPAEAAVRKVLAKRGSNTTPATRK